MTEEFLNRFGGIARLYGLAALERFSRSHVMVVGLGGVGSWSVEALARSGIGELSLVDLDDLCLTNINRQIHALDSTIGQSKAAVLASRLKQINPEIKVNLHPCFYQEKNASDLLEKHRPDIVIDAIDSIRAKCHLLAQSRELQIPIISSGGAGGRMDPSQIQIADLSRTFGDPLLLSVRKKLRKEYRFPSAGKKAKKFHIRAVFSSEPPQFPQCDGTTSNKRPREMSGSLKCDSGFGAVTHITATFGNLCAAEILNFLYTKE